MLGTFRTGEATLFSWDVAVQKRALLSPIPTMVTLWLCPPRTVGFLAQSHYPPGINANHAGPYFGQQEMFSGLMGTLSDVSPIPGAARIPTCPNWNPRFSRADFPFIVMVS